MTRINSRAKGASSEREFAAEIMARLNVRLVRVLDQSRNGGFDLAPAPDQTGKEVDALRRMAIECKRYADIQQHMLTRFWLQACRQGDAAGLVPVLAYRADRQPWTIRVPLAWLAGIGEASADLSLTAALSLDGFAEAVRHLAGRET